jgi:hypothetical protein
MQIIRSVLALAIAGVLAGCGSKAQPGPGGGAAAPGAASQRAQKSGDATAEEVAEETRGDVRCPAKVKSKARAAQAPIDDIVGVRPGLTYEEAANLVLCTNDLMTVQTDSSRGFNINTYGQTLRQGFSARFAEPHVQKTSQQYLKEMNDDFIARSGNAVRDDSRPGQSHWYVGTMGMPGQEHVISVGREEWFAEGKNPTMASVEQALLKKYGTPTRHQKAGNQIYLSWAYDPFGRLITETSPLFNQCSAVTGPDGGANFSPDCGTVVGAMVVPMKDNVDLGKSMSVAIVDQSGGYESLTATQQAFERSEAQRQAQQVEAAAKNADTPNL